MTCSWGRGGCVSIFSKWLSWFSIYQSDTEVFRHVAHAGMDPSGTVFWVETSPAEGCESEHPLSLPSSPLWNGAKEGFFWLVGLHTGPPRRRAAVAALSHGSVLNLQLYAFLGEESVAANWALVTPETLPVGWWAEVAPYLQTPETHPHQLLLHTSLRVYISRLHLQSTGQRCARGFGWNRVANK